MGYEVFTKNREKVVETKTKYRWVKLSLCIFGLVVGIAMMVMSGYIPVVDDDYMVVGFLQFGGLVVFIVSLIILIFTPRTYQLGAARNVSDESIDRNALTSMQVRNSQRYPDSNKGPKI